MSVSDPSTTFLGLESEWSDFDRSQVIILPVPYERTTSYGKGTALAPELIIKASAYIELYDEELKSEIFRVSGGISTLPPMRFNTECLDAAAVGSIRAEVQRLITLGKKVVCIGGEHTIAVGAALAHAQRYPGLSILQFDAHSDLRQEYEGNRYSHASVMARIHEHHRDIVQVGIRSQCQEEADFIRESKINTFYAIDIRKGKYGNDRESWHEAVISLLKENVYVTFDCDFFDPSLMPAVGTPEPGGFSWNETIAFLRYLSRNRKVVGFDVNELAPIPYLIHPQFTIAKLIYKLIGYMFCKQ